ncbi:hypothetical protein FDP41_007717 [Naegleria fowleri]|uniref:Uncharacterized protein n=1 Tax=Naegleria fowleri TaxID=5763 RepID=A0A6A5C9Z2_NAEFO|nr:uncharacterized protein FDP41_007717 [Naegleria fowleri]KAF0983802.1 hypothetical protein FDP41_007717 [Naegleria fowleri]CAG4713208.1 unnamed protein product [Naegleria fowleri]
MPPLLISPSFTSFTTTFHPNIAAFNNDDSSALVPPTTENSFKSTQLRLYHKTRNYHIQSLTNALHPKTEKMKSMKIPSDGQEDGAAINNTSRKQQNPNRSSFMTDLTTTFSNQQDPFTPPSPRRHVHGASPLLGITTTTPKESIFPPNHHPHKNNHPHNNQPSQDPLAAIFHSHLQPSLDVDDDTTNNRQLSDDDHLMDDKLLSSSSFSLMTSRNDLRSPPPLSTRPSTPLFPRAPHESSHSLLQKEMESPPSLNHEIHHDSSVLSTPQTFSTPTKLTSIMKDHDSSSNTRNTPIGLTSTPPPPNDDHHWLMKQISSWFSFLIHYFFKSSSFNDATLFKRILKQLVLINPYLRANIRRGREDTFRARSYGGGGGGAPTATPTTSTISYHNHSLAPWQWSL